MNSNPEVMQSAAPAPLRPGQDNGRHEATPAHAQAHPAAAPRAGETRTSEDPLRRTDRYRLVMPYSLRI